MGIEPYKMDSNSSPAPLVSQSLFGRYTLWKLFILSFLLHVGHFFCAWMEATMQPLQKIWPQIVDDASVILFMQIGQEKVGCFGGSWMDSTTFFPYKKICNSAKIILNLTIEKVFKTRQAGSVWKYIRNWIRKSTDMYRSLK